MKKLLVIFAAVAFIWVFAAPASAIDWNFYGSARMATFYISDDLGDIYVTNSGDDEDDQVQWDLQSNSRLGATVKGENLSGRVELALKGTNGGDIDVGTRRIYGVWDAGWGQIKVGKDYTPTNQFISGQVFDGDLGLLGVGTFYARRPGQISLAFGGFEIALITPGDNAPISENDGTSLNANGGDYDRYLPKIEAKWGMAFDTFNFTLQGGFQTVTWEDVTSQDDGDQNDVDVTSWMLGAMAGVNFGPLYIKGAVSYSQNPFTANWFVYRSADYVSLGSDIWDGDDDVNDFNYFQSALVLGFKLSDMVTFEAGGGYTNADFDDVGVEDFNPWAVYAQAVIQMAPGVWLIPEVGYFDADDPEGVDLPTTFYAGAKWQIDF